MNKVLIIGGVAGGATAAARLRRLDEKVQIVMFERGSYISFANCGLPYHVGEMIPERSSLLLQTPEAMKEKFNIDVRIRQEVISIDRENKKVSVKKHETGEVYEESYDTLVIATGSSPLKPPIPGIDSKRVFSLWTVPDTDAVKAYIETYAPKRAVVVGGGFIGLEMAENLKAKGIDVTMVEMLSQVMPPLDFEMAKILERHLVEQGVTVNLNSGVSAFEEKEKTVDVVLSDGRRIQADFVLLSIGVRPNSEIAKSAGLTLNARGGIVTDAHLKTSDPNIYAVGDVIEVEDFIQHDRTMIPLAGPANKQGRICADNIMGAQETYDGTQGTSVAKVFELTAASTGASEKALLRKGLVRGKDFETALVHQRSHASYYPGSTLLTIKLVFSMDGKKIYGAQIVGRDGVDKRIDVIATTIRLGGGIEALKSLELAYAPPYSSAKDPVNMTGFVAENILSGKVALAGWNALETEDANRQILDVREDVERVVFSIPGAIGIPLGKLRENLDQLDGKREIIVFCEIAVRAYNGARILMQNGFENVKVYPGGASLYRMLYGEGPQKEEEEQEMPKQEPDIVQSEVGDINASISVNCSGLQCPGPIMKVFQSMNNMEDGQIIEVFATDPGFARDVDTWCRRTGNTLVKSEKRGNQYVVYIKKGTDSEGVPAVAQKRPDGKTIVVFSGDLDKVLASFIIANGAAAMGRPVTMFFTFWGLNVLRRPQKQHVKKSLIEKMFGMMMPRGVKKLKLSKMNMAGIGTAMMKKVMRDKRVDALETLMKQAMQNGVKLIACTMSMDVMGIKAEELIDGVTLGGVATYLGDAEESDVNLFIS